MSSARANNTNPIVDDRPNTVLWFGGVVMFLFFGALGGWAATAPFDSAVVASAVLKVESNRKSIQHREGGIVAEILVKDGQTVKKGQPLIRLDKTQAQANVEILLRQINALRAQEARLLAERDEASAVIFPKELMKHAADREISGLMQAQVHQFESRRTALGGQVSILRQRIKQAQEQIAGTQSLIGALERQMRSIIDELQDVQALYTAGNTTIIRLRQLERAVAELQGRSGEHQATIARLKQAIGEAEMQIIQLSKDRQAEVANELRDVQTRLLDLDPRQEAALDTLQRTEITTPSDGIVVGLNAFTIGGVVAPGERLMDIVPSDDSLVLDAQIKVEDIDNLRPGLAATVHLTAFRERITPIVHGMVSRVSADRMVDQRTGVPYFLAEVKIKLEELPEKKRNSLYPGMPASVSIPIEGRTALDYLIRPLSDSITHSFRER